MKQCLSSSSEQRDGDSGDTASGARGRWQPITDSVIHGDSPTLHDWIWPVCVCVCVWVDG